MNERLTRPDGTHRSRGGDLVVSYLLAVPIALGAAAVFGATPQFSFLAQNFTLIFAGGVLMFLAGAVRGAAGSPAIALALMAAGLAALFCVFWGYAVVAAGVASVAFAFAALGARRTLGAVRFGAVPLALAIAGTAALGLRSAGLV